MDRSSAVVLVSACVASIGVACGSFGSNEGDEGPGPDAGGGAIESGTPDGSSGEGATDASNDGGAGDASIGCPGVCIGFEDGFAALSVTGSPAIEKTTPIKGLQSMSVQSGSAYVTIDLAPATEVWISFYLRTGQVMSNATPLAMLAGGSPVLALRASGLSLALEGSGLTNAALSTTFTPGTTYRVALHTKAVASSLEVEGWLATGDAAFGARAVSGVVTGGNVPTSFRIGAADSAIVHAVFDDVVVSTTGLPPPSP